MGLLSAKLALSESILMASSSAVWRVVLRSSSVFSRARAEEASDALLLAMDASRFSFSSRSVAVLSSAFSRVACLRSSICCCSVRSSRWSLSLDISARVSASSALSCSARRAFFSVSLASSESFGVDLCAADGVAFRGMATGGVTTGAAV